MIPPVVTRAWLASHPDAVLVDARSYFDGRSGLDAFRAGHLPGAVHIDVAEVSAAPSDAGGRHPLPTSQAFARVMASAGIANDSTVVAYDDASGSMAARLVWMLRTVGTDAAVLDGGLRPDDDLTTNPPGASCMREFRPVPWPDEALATIDEAAAGPLVLDARAAARYEGAPSSLDPKSGHIPGALSAQWADNVEADGFFRTPEALRERFAALGVTDATQAIVYCGSGVTACHDLLAMERAGLGRARLFPGSWSQYGATDRPVATGSEPGERG